MADKYSFITKWQLKSPVELVWDAIYKSSEWPKWWKGVIDVKLFEKGDADDIGEIREFTWKSALPYRISFKSRLTYKELFKTIRGEAFGELEGLGVWHFEERGGVTYVQYNWDVYTNKAWMNHLSFILKPAFKYNHDIVMRWGAKGLAKKLNAELLSC